MIVKRQDGWHILSESKDNQGRRKHLGGPYRSKEAAEKRLHEIEFFKHKYEGRSARQR